MRILRGGASKYGITLLADTEIGSPRQQKYGLVNFFSIEPSVELHARDIEGVGLRGHYDYRVDLSLKEVVEILTAVLDTGIDNAPNEIAEEFKDIEVQLLRLLMCIKGFQSQPIEKKS